MAPFHLALISMPWPLANRPSLQLAAIKSFIQARDPDVRVDCYHPYLDVAGLLGIHRYNAIAERTWAAESVYAYLLNPAKRQEILELFRREYGGKKASLPELETMAQKLHALHQSKHFNTPWDSFDLVGLSISLSQLTSSLYLIRNIRTLHPHCRIVAGGSCCAGELGRSLLASVPEIDFVVSGEGELPLLELIRRLKKGQPQDKPEIPGLYEHGDQGEILGGGLSQLPDLRELPLPEYNDYFRELKRQPGFSNLVPALPVESSRGCWWHRVKSGSVERACRFCNLNLQWDGYRRKKPIQVAREMDELARRHAGLKFFFVDNILDPATTAEMFELIAALGRDFELFTELRASATHRDLVRMRRAGVTEVQIGIESLSSRLLAKINKGTSVIQNIEVMKHCEELGIQHYSNLLLGFPGSDTEDVEETLRNLPFVQSYRPLRKVQFWLGQNSPVALSPGQYGIRGIRNHPNYSRLLPDSLADSLCLMVKTYAGDRVRQRSLWRPVSREVARWRRRYPRLRRQHLPAPLLGYRDGGDFLLIRRRAEDSNLETFRLRGTSREIYLFCRTRKPLAGIRAAFPRFTDEQLQHFISDLVDKRLMFQEKDQVLSLAVNEAAFSYVDPT